MEEDVLNYIKKMHYTWTLEALISHYKKHLEGWYIPHTAEDVIFKFEGYFKEAIKNYE